MNQREFIGDSRAIQELRKLVRRVAQSKANAVLIYGETGTGKALVAQKLHEQSERARKPFVDVNCASIPADMFDQELFGQDKGSFAGALSRKNGLIEAAHGGTLFLDEIRGLNHLAQTKFLGLLDRKSFRRIGAVHDVEVDVRFICATNQILFQEVKKGNFRDDLYYRLQVVAVNLPPLRERGDDCFLLTEYFVARFNKKYNRAIKGWDSEVENVFRAYGWPGNVRELENLLERIFVLESDDVIRISHIPPRIMREFEAASNAAVEAEALPAGLTFQEATEAYQTKLIKLALKQHGGRKAEAAAALGLTRHALRHQMSKLAMR
ncbi:sigma-54 interaction domain-containing protein [Oceaniglobus ichthyenteri]|uniref:sigma-54 interaction domain-containing protein n=1 Tax=Oceaniglobus ichthyenteri TaxID=2136177 RepID=UPI000D3B12B1|nr:sigma-54 dependent transcriptional regulator [Oceaniglobus ichthyenteri]